MSSISGFCDTTGILCNLLELDEKDQRIADVEAEDQRLRERNPTLEDRLAAVEAHLGLDESEPAQGVADD